MQRGKTLETSESDGDCEMSEAEDAISLGECGPPPTELEADSSWPHDGSALPPQADSSTEANSPLNWLNGAAAPPWSAKSDPYLS